MFYQRLKTQKQGKAMKIHIDDDESQQAEEGGFSPAKVLVLVTSLKQAVLAGATKLDVYSHVDCQPGMLVTLSNPRDPNVAPEQRWIVAIGSLILDRPLEHAYGEGTVVTVTKKASKSSADAVLNDKVTGNRKFKPGSNLGVSGKSTLTMSAKSDLTVSGKSTDMSLFDRKNHNNRIYPIDDGLSVDASILNNSHHSNYNNNRSSKEINAVRKAKSMRFQVEAEEEEEVVDEEQRLQLEEERKGREAAMQRRLQSASTKETKRCMQEKPQDEESETDKRVFVEPRELVPSRAAKRSPVAVVIDQSTVTAAEHRGMTRRNDNTNRSNTDFRTSHRDESRANDVDDLSDLNFLTRGILSERMNSRQFSNRHLSPLRRAQSAQSSCRSDTTAATATAPVATATATALSTSSKVSPNIGAGHVDWDDLSVHPIASPERHEQHPTLFHSDSIRQGQGWANTSSRARSFRDMHAT